MSEQDDVARGVAVFALALVGVVGGVLWVAGWDWGFLGLAALGLTGVYVCGADPTEGQQT